MIISSQNAKGGCGKTTTAMYIATACYRRGLSTSVVDLDIHKSSLRWSEIAAEDGCPLPFTVASEPVRNISGIAATVAPSKVLVVDTPASNPEAIDIVTAISDFVVVPITSRRADLETSWTLIDALSSSGVPFALLVTMVESHTRAFRGLCTQLDKLDPPRFVTQIPRREAIQRAYGTLPAEMFGYDEVVETILETLDD